MIQETKEIDAPRFSLAGIQSSQGLVTLMALVGARTMDAEMLRRKSKLSPEAFERSLQFLQREYLVDIVSSLNGDQVSEKVVLTNRGEELLIRMLERTCELPELR